ncbi:MAG: hypothetical protein ABI905_09200 [Betaproteobacteria bacterium]
MLGKLGQLLNKDVGALVKDAGKVLNSDVGSLAKGAGKMLNADLGDLLRESPAPAAADEVIPAPAPAKVPVEAKETKETKAPAAAPVHAPAPAPAPPAASPAPAPAPAAAFDPDATQKINPDATQKFDSTQKLDPRDEATVVMAAGGGKPEATLPQLTDSLTSRHTRPMPTGTSLLTLLPHAVGEFVRPHATPVGELTSDPVLAMYSVSGHPVAVRLVQCWDEEEARDRLNDVKRQAGDNFRMGEDRSWIMGETLQGLMFAWTRGNYSYTATAPKGEITMVRFLFAFPY